jgi:hypothetical protein
VLQNSPNGSGAFSGAECGVSGDFDSDLQEVIDAWPMLPNAVKTALVVKVRSTVNAKGKGAV